MYSDYKYGLIKYGDNIEETEPGENQYIDIAQYAPLFISQIHEMAEIYQVMGQEIGLAKYRTDDMVDQCFVVSATWGLILWEKVYGIVSNFSLSYEQRREIILAKMRGQGTTTAEMIKRAAETFSGGDVEVIEDNAHYCFIVRFVGIYGIPRNMQAFIRMLDELKPAHLAYKFEYKYVVWNDMRPYIWDYLKLYTWDGIRVMEMS
jgi:hypothetical protein